jgi:hypothetical protein
VPQVAAVLPQIAKVAASGPLILAELAGVAARFTLLTLPQVLPDLAAIATDLPRVGAQLAAVLTDLVSILPDLSRILPMVGLAGKYGQ